MTNAIQIVTTFATHAAAGETARELVRRHQAACAQINGPIESIYRWDGLIEHSEEYQLTIKTRRELFDAVTATIKEFHPYDVPEIVAFDIVAGSDAYLKWIDESVTLPA